MPEIIESNEGEDVEEEIDDPDPLPVEEDTAPAQNNDDSQDLPVFDPYNQGNKPEIPEGDQDDLLNLIDSTKQNPQP